MGKEKIYLIELGIGGSLKISLPDALRVITLPEREFPLS
jgi:hypothetical protein